MMALFHQCYLMNNDCFRKGQFIIPKGVMVHSTGANNVNISRYVQPVSGIYEIIGINRNKNDWNHPGIEKCVHAFIGRFANGEIGICQTLPWNMRGWHAGGRANDTHISFEICEDGLTDPNYFKAVYDAAMKLTGDLCLQYNLDPLKDGVVICHQEGARRGWASWHVDVEHWFPKFGKTMDDFRKDVANYINGKEWIDLTKDEFEVLFNEMYESKNRVYRTLNDVPEWYRPAIEKLIKMPRVDDPSKMVIEGTGDDDDDGENEINVSADLCRVMTLLDRAGKL